MKELAASRTALAGQFEIVDKDNVDKLSDAARDTQIQVFASKCKLLTDQQKANEAKITEYEAQRKKLQDGSGPGTSVAADFQDKYADKAGIPRDVPRPPTATGEKNEADYWTSISTKVSSSFSHEETEVQSTSWSTGGSVGWGWFSAGASASHSDSHSNVSKQMANSSVKISFDCMRVDITRPWLRGELFYDHDLSVAASES